MGTALIYLLVVAAVAAALFGLAAVVFGRGEELAPLPPGATPTRLPAGEIDGDDVRELRFPQAVRGYRMDEVDWVLDRLADELDRVGAERDGLLARVAELESALASAALATGARAQRRRHGLSSRGGLVSVVELVMPVDIAALRLGRNRARVRRLPRRRVGPAAARRHRAVRAAEPGGLPVRAVLAGHPAQAAGVPGRVRRLRPGGRGRLRRRRRGSGCSPTPASSATGRRSRPPSTTRAGCWSWTRRSTSCSGRSRRIRPAGRGPAGLADVPATSPESTAMARELKRRGLRFVGPDHVLRADAGRRAGRRPCADCWRAAATAATPECERPAC